MSSANATDPTDAGDGVPQVVLDDPQQLVGHTILNRFRVDGVLGLGGMGAVLRCHHLGLQRDVAVKVLHPTMSANPEISARFAREAMAMSRMNHPNCVRVLDFGEFDVGGPTMQYLAMELLSGCELAELMKEPLPAPRALQLMDQVFAGLGHAHAAGVVHRDLKPENVFVTDDHDGEERLKIVDFGIAKIVSGVGSTDNMTVAGAIFGTPRYMSPEQCAGGKIDARTDVYAAGIILYEMLAGRVPFDDPEDPTQVIHKHILAPVPPLPDSVPRPVAELVMAMLEKERAHRVPSIDVAHDRLMEIRRRLANGTLMKIPAADLRPAPAGASRKRTWSRLPVVAASVGFVVVIAGAAWLLREDPEPDAAVAEVDATEVAAPTPAPSDADAPEPEPAPAPVANPAKAAVEPVAALLQALPTGPQAEQAQLDKIDAMLADKAFDAASDAISRLLDDFPKDARLHVRNGRALRKGDAGKALAAYARALELQPMLLHDEGFLEELLALMGRPAVAEAALDLAIRQLGSEGGDYLVGRVNDDAKPVPYADRHRALRALEDLGRAGAANAELNVALDLWQAKQARDPCAAYGGALTAIEAEPAAYYLGSVHRSTPPKKCAGLAERRQTVADTLSSKFEIAESDWTVPAAYANSKKRRGRRGGGGGLLRRLGIR